MSSLSFVVVVVVVDAVLFSFSFLVTRDQASEGRSSSSSC